MDATKDYQGFSQSITNTGNTTTERYKAFEEQAKAFAKAYKVGQTSEYGSLASIDVDPDEGPYWTVTLTWSNTSDGMGGSSPTGTSVGPTASTLNIRMLTMPLESKKNYKTKWNYYLVGLGPKQTVPSWWETSKRIETNSEYWKWIKSSSDLPQPKLNLEWKIYKDPTQPGVDYYQLPTYELTESGKHNSQKQAGWAISKRARKNSSPQKWRFRNCFKIRRKLVM